MSLEISVSHLKREPEFVKQNLIQTKGKVYTKKDLEIQIPKRYTQKSMAILGEQNYSVGIFPLIMEGRYAVINVMSLIHFASSSVEEVTIDDTEYYLFRFSKGDEVFAETQVVRDDGMTFNVFDEFISQGNIPWFITYIDLANIYDTSDVYADAKMPLYKYPYEVLVSLMTRTEKDRMRLYRYSLNQPKDLEVPPSFAQLKSVMYMSQSTLNKIAGAYMDEGIQSALVYPSEHVEKIEKLLRE